MSDELDVLLAGIADPKQRELLLNAFHELAGGDPNSLPVHLALITTAQWRAALNTTILLKRNTEALAAAEKRWAACNEALTNQEALLEATAQQYKSLIEDAANRIAVRTRQAVEGVDVGKITERWNKSIESQVLNSDYACVKLKHFAETVEKVKKVVGWPDLFWPALCGLLLAALGWAVAFHIESKRAAERIAEADQQVSTLTANLRDYQAAVAALNRHGVTLRPGGFNVGNLHGDAVLFRGIPTDPAPFQGTDGFCVPLEEAK